MDAVIVATARTPIGRAGKGSLIECRPDDLSATIVEALLAKVPALDPADVEDVIWGTGLYLADTLEEAARRVEAAHDERYKWFAPFGFVRYADEQGRTWGTPGAPARTPFLRDGIAQKAWFCGPPTHVIEGIKSVEARYPGLEHYMIHFAEGLTLREFTEQLQWFAREVMPAFRP